MSLPKDYKSLEYMIHHFKNIKIMSFPVFVGAINDLSIMANGGMIEERASLYPCDYHTDQFFIDLLQSLGFNKDGSLLER